MQAKKNFRGTPQIPIGSCGREGSLDGGMEAAKRNSDYVIHNCNHTFCGLVVRLGDIVHARGIPPHPVGAGDHYVAGGGYSGAKRGVSPRALIGQAGEQFGRIKGPEKRRKTSMKKQKARNVEVEDLKDDARALVTATAHIVENKIVEA